MSETQYLLLLVKVNTLGHPRSSTTETTGTSETSTNIRGVDSSPSLVRSFPEKENPIEEESSGKFFSHTDSVLSVSNLFHFSLSGIFFIKDRNFLHK